MTPRPQGRRRTARQRVTANFEFRWRRPPASEAAATVLDGLGSGGRALAFAGAMVVDALMPLLAPLAILVRVAVGLGLVAMLALIGTGHLSGGSAGGQSVLFWVCAIGFPTGCVWVLWWGRGYNARRTAGSTATPGRVLRAAGLLELDQAAEESQPVRVQVQIVAVDNDAPGVVEGVVDELAERRALTADRAAVDAASVVRGTVVP